MSATAYRTITGHKWNSTKDAECCIECEQPFIKGDQVFNYVALTIHMRCLSDFIKSSKEFLSPLNPLPEIAMKAVPFTAKHLPLVDRVNAFSYGVVHETYDEDHSKQRSVPVNYLMDVSTIAGGLLDLMTPRKAEDWHEDDGDVLWWKSPIVEGPFCGTPLDSGWIKNYYTHWTPLPIPRCDESGVVIIP